MQNGRIVATNAVVTGEINATKGVFNNVVVNGSSRSPFVSPGDPFDTNYSDNVAMLSEDGGWMYMYSLPWDVAQSGRVIRITNYKWGSQTSSGASEISAPTGKYFFENGNQSSKLVLSRECIELLGYGTPTQFYGWIVLNRLNLMTNYQYGRKLNVLAVGRITITDTAVYFKKCALFDGKNVSFGTSITTLDGKTLSISRTGTGRCQMMIPSGWFHRVDDMLVMATGEGWVHGSSSAPCKATATPTSTTSIRFDVSDNETNKDGSFNFMIMNMNDWMY